VSGPGMPEWLCPFKGTADPLNLGSNGWNWNVSIGMCLYHFWPVRHKYEEGNLTFCLDQRLCACRPLLMCF
jgi:hypothetical protein